MNTELNVRPVQSSSVSLVRNEVRPERQVARTELPETQVVLSSPSAQTITQERDEKTAKVRAELNSRLDEFQSSPLKKTEIDDASQQVVFRTVSAETGEIVSQFPDEAYLRQRAYAQQLQKAELLQQSEERLEHVEKVI